MATYDEIFAGYEPPKTSNYAMKRYFDKVFAGYEPSKKDDEEHSVLETLFDFTPTGMLYNFLDSHITLFRRYRC